MPNDNCLKGVDTGDEYRRSSTTSTAVSRPSTIWKVLVMAAIVAGAALSPLLAPPLAMAAEANSASAQIPQEKLDSLLAPIALYPDQLLSQTLMAATYPLDVVAAARFVEENKELKGDALDKAVAQKSWDPSVQSLTAYPQVLLMMNEKLDWTQELGDAFLADQKRVMQTVQTLRHKAEAQGNLKSNEQQKVVKQEQVIVIEPATEVVYVPTYNPTVVYGSWWAPSYPPYYYPPPPYYYPPGGMFVAGVIGFGIGVAIANNHWGWCGANWGGGDVDINVNRNNTFINNNAEFKNKARNGNWQHNPEQRKGVGYGNAKTRDQYRKSDPGAVSSRRDVRGYDSAQRGDARGGAGVSDRQRSADRAGGNPSAGTRDAQRGGDRGDRSQGGASAGTRDSQIGGDRSGVNAGTRDAQGRGERNMDRSSSTSPSFDSRQSRQQTQHNSNRGASSRSQMSSSRSGGGGRSAGGGGRSGGGRR